MRRGGLSFATCAALAALAAAARPVRAEEEETLEGRHRALALAPRDAVLPSGVAWRAFAQLAGEGAADLAAAPGTPGVEGTAAAAAGVELRVSTPRCASVRIGGQARLSWADGAGHPSAEQWLSACLADEAALAEVGHHLEWDVRPSLLAPVRLRAGRNRRETAYLHLAPFRVALEPPPADPPPRTVLDQLVGFETDIRVSWLWSADAPLSWIPRLEVVGIRASQSPGAAGAEHRTAIDVFVVTGVLSDVGSAASSWLLRIERFPLGPVRASAGIGLSFAGIGPFIEGYGRATQITAPLAMLAVETGDGMLRRHARWSHSVELTATGLAVSGSRLEGGLSLGAAGRRAAFDAFLALSRIHAHDATSIFAATGGASASLSHRLGPHLSAQLQLEAARSFHALAPAADAMPPLAAPRWGVNAMAALQATAGR